MGYDKNQIAKELADAKAALAEATAAVAELKKPARDSGQPVLGAPVHAKAADVEELGRWGWSSLGEQLNAVAAVAQSKGQRIDKRLTTEHYQKAHAEYATYRKAATGLGEFVGSDGGFLLAPTFLEEIWKIVHSRFNMMDETAVRQITGPSVKLRAVNETSRATGSRRGGLTAYWVDEGESFTASKPTFRTMELKPHKLQVLYYATEELLADGGGMLTQEVAEYAADEINFLVSDAIVNGTGAGQPKGVLNSAALVTVAKETGQPAATIVYENVVNMWARLHADSMTRAKWYINQSAYPQLHTMAFNVGTGGMPAFLPPGGVSSAPYGTLYGRPIQPIEQCSALGTVGDIILADMTQYMTVTRGGLQSAVSMHVEFLTDQQVFKFTFRVDGNSKWQAPLTPFKDTTKTQSPFVALAARS